MAATDPRDAAQQLRDRTEAAILALRGDLRLDKTVRLREIAAVWVQAKNEMGMLRAAFAGFITDQRNTLEQGLFAAPGVASGADRVARDASYRDAVQRASECKNADELAGLLQRAVRMNDPLLQQACFLVACEQMEGQPFDGAGSPFRAVIDHFVEFHPELAEKVDALLSFDAALQDPKFMMQRHSFFNLAKPQEFAMEDEWKIRQIAGDAGAPLKTGPTAGSRT